jgi:hypothetical protein
VSQSSLWPWYEGLKMKSVVMSKVLLSLSLSQCAFFSGNLDNNTSSQYLFICLSQLHSCCESSSLKLSAPLWCWSIAFQLLWMKTRDWLGFSLRRPGPGWMLTTNQGRRSEQNCNFRTRVKSSIGMCRTVYPVNTAGRIHCRQAGLEELWNL